MPHAQTKSLLLHRSTSLCGLKARIRTFLPAFSPIFKGGVACLCSAGAPAAGRQMDGVAERVSGVDERVLAPEDVVLGGAVSMETGAR